MLHLTVLLILKISKNEMIFFNYFAKKNNLQISVKKKIFKKNFFFLLSLVLKVGGWATEYGNILTFATVRGAAHMVPYAQPARALVLFDSIVSGKRLPNVTHPSIE